MIVTLLITVLVEGVVAVLYSTRRGKAVIPILVTSVFGNLLTQSALWIVLTYSFSHYLMALALTETVIWGIESFLLYIIPANHLNLKDACLLSFVMNGISLALGWFLPV